MIIGLTYDLRSDYLAMGFGEEETAEFDRAETIDALEAAIREFGHECERIGNAWRLTELLVQGRRWDLVFNIAEGLRGIGREAQVPAILDLYGIPYTFSDPMVMSLTLHKGMTKRVIRDAGLATADFWIASDRKEASAGHLPPPYFVKPVAEGTGKGISGRSIVRSKEDLPGICEDLISRFHQPVLIERFLSGREFTTGLAGTGAAARVIGTMEILLMENAEKSVYSYSNKEDYEQRVRYRPVCPETDPVVRQTEALALSAWKVLGCRDGGRMDIRCDDAGRPCFIEVNPLAGLHPKHSDLPIICSLFNISYIRLIGWILDSALERMCLEKTGGKRS